MGLESTLDFPPYVSADAKELVCALMHSDPQERLSSEAARRHRWLAQDMAALGLDGADGDDSFSNGREAAS